MKQRLLHLLYFALLILTVFTVMKVAFMLYNCTESAFSAHDVLNVIIHGAPLDLSTTGYICIIPWLLCFISIWTNGKWIRTVSRIYAWVTGIVLSVFLLADCLLYDFWQYKIDATIIGYLDSPNEIFASLSAGYVILAFLMIFGMMAVIIGLSYFIGRKGLSPCRKPRLASIVFLFIAGLMFLIIRGGVGRSTMNVGNAYYSPNQFLNHSAVNPLFNFVSSALKFKDYDELYRFFPEEERAANFDSLHYSTLSIDADSILNTQRPNVVIVLMEGMGATFIEALGGEKGITPNFNNLCKEGILFTQCYANSYRTDRGTVCTLSGYPSFPEISVMKLPEKTAGMSSIAHSLSKYGYKTSFLYGGDINFTNTNSYLMSVGYTDILGDTYFPVKTRKTHSWGVTDQIVLDTLYNQIIRQPADKLSFRTCLTLASHEDWQVPYNRIANNPKANSMAYLDHCIGNLVNRLKRSPAWDNLLLIFLPDHGISYPPGNTESDIERYHIPMLWVGGAVKGPRKIQKICNQTDLAATLLGQLGIDHKDFTFSRDVMSKTYTYPCAIHTFSGGVAFIDSSGVSIQDLKSNAILVDSPTPNPDRIKNAHTLLQTQINDFANR